ncbi:MAG: signal peptidase I [Parcubacteria group bacterium Athens0714_16]|nr:MAG: signal peptidase I [Parcubacteria group bacterium Athens0714_16]
METENFNEKILSPEKKGGFIKDIITVVLLVVFIVIPIRVFIAQPFVVFGESMSPTFENGDYLIVDQISYRFNAPQRQQVIIFKYPNDTTKFFIKRIIGLPNETVEIVGSEIFIKNTEHPGGFKLDETYIANGGNNNMTKTLGNSEYFVVGDNRNASSDSRIWGPLDKKFIVGRTFLQLLPINRIGLLPDKF